MPKNENALVFWVLHNHSTLSCDLIIALAAAPKTAPWLFDSSDSLDALNVNPLDILFKDHFLKGFLAVLNRFKNWNNRQLMIEDVTWCIGALGRRFKAFASTFIAFQTPILWLSRGQIAVILEEYYVNDAKKYARYMKRHSGASCQCILYSTRLAK